MAPVPSGILNSPTLLPTQAMVSNGRFLNDTVPSLIDDLTAAIQTNGKISSSTVIRKAMLKTRTQAKDGGSHIYRQPRLTFKLVIVA